MKLVLRDKKYFEQYREYCREFHEHNIIYFRPTNPEFLDDNWFERTKEWYDNKMSGKEYPQSLYYYAVENEKFIGEFQLRLVLDENIMNGIGSIGYSVRLSEQGKGYGKEILKQGCKIAKEYGMNKVLLTINNNNIASIKCCESAGGILEDIIESENEAEGKHLLRRYWIYL